MYPNIKYKTSQVLIAGEEAYRKYRSLGLEGGAMRGDDGFVVTASADG